MSDRPQKQDTAKAARETFSINTCLNCSQCVQLSFNDEKCVLMLCVSKVAFLKSGHKYAMLFILIKLWKNIISVYST